jgi:hypothetical protein
VTLSQSSEIKSPESQVVFEISGLISVLGLEIAKSCLDFASFLEKIHFLFCHAVILTLSFPIVGVPEP